MTDSPADAVRTYLVALKDPSVLIDQEAVAALRAELESTVDPIDRLKVREQLLAAEEPDVAGAERAFISHAKAWAADARIGAQAFLNEGVPGPVLRRAGFSGIPTQSSPRRRRSRRQVSADAVRRHIPATFTVRSLADTTGASTQTVRQVVRELLDSGDVVEKGTDPDHTGRGRAPMVYGRVS